MKLGYKIAITFIDYSAAFDSVSHKFLDQTLKAAGATNDAMFISVYRLHQSGGTR